jgi:hypothetical protein
MIQVLGSGVASNLSVSQGLRVERLAAWYPLQLFIRHTLRNGEGALGSMTLYIIKSSVLLTHAYAVTWLPTVC